MRTRTFTNVTKNPKIGAGGWPAGAASIELDDIGCDKPSPGK